MIPQRAALTAMLVAAAALAAPGAVAATLYKLIDKSGKVTYSEEPPKNFDGQVVRIEIDPNANTATMPKLQTAPADAVKAMPGTKPGAPTFSAQRNLEKARQALTEARDNPSDSDYRFLANVGGGTRRVPSDEYLARLAELEEAVRKAEADVRRSQGGK